jgi:phosphatidate phosphatase APP1
MGQLRDDERLIFFPSIARQVDDGWAITVHGWVHEPEERRVLGAVLRRIIGIDRDKLSDAERETYRERTRYFLPDNERRKVITVKAGEWQRKSPATSANGHFKFDWKLTDAEFSALSFTNQCLSVCALLDTNDSRAFIGNAHVLSNRGLSVISDIDDTIKISEVRDREALLLNTFCRPFKAAPGMAELYRDWAKRGAQFHYVSASPWQLYVPLAEFVAKADFPAGTFHMKDFHVKDRTFLALLGDPQAYKLKVIVPMLERFPDRRFVLVGDSGEKDPEVYGVLGRKFPQQVVAILIRNVTGENRAEIRYKNAFRELPNERWLLFDHPKELAHFDLGLSP